MKKVVLALLAGLAFANQVYAGEYLVTSTPYDHKIRESGLYDHPIWTSSSTIDESFLAESFATARSFRYLRDKQNDHWQTAEETSERHAGDCEDKAIWLFSRLTSSGFTNLRLVIGKLRDVDIAFHVWVTYQAPDSTIYILDPSAQKRIWKATEFDSGWYKSIYSFDGRHSYSYSARKSL